MTLSPRTKFLLIGVGFLVLFNCTLRRASAQQGDKGAGAALTGSSSLMTNYLEKGISQSENQASLWASADYTLGQGRVGLWAASVKYSGTDERIRLKGKIGYLFDWTQNFKTFFDYSFVRHMGGTARDCHVVTFKITAFEYDFYFESEDNFEASGDRRTWYGAGKSWPLPWDLILLTKLGYSVVESSLYSSHFDADFAVSYQMTKFAANLGLTYNSASGDFNSRAGAHLYLSGVLNF